MSTAIRDIQKISPAPNAAPLATRILASRSAAFASRPQTRRKDWLNVSVSQNSLNPLSLPHVAQGLNTDDWTWNKDSAKTEQAESASLWPPSFGLNDARGPNLSDLPGRSRVRSKPKPVSTAKCKIARWMRSRYSVSSPFRQCWCATPSKAVAIGLFSYSPDRVLSAPLMGSFKALGRLVWSRRSGQWSALGAGGPRENLDHRRSGCVDRSRPPSTRTGGDQGAYRSR
jgi:hypothetical protein